MKKIIMLFGVIAILSSCGFGNITREINFTGDQKPAIGQIEHTNKSIKMEVIDEIPKFGVIIVRFIDAGHTRYLVLSKDMMQVLSSTSETKGSKDSSKVTYEDSSITVLK